jgi:hypothetical protein
MKIVIETTPHSRQRYPTVGDWFTSKGVLHIKVSDMNNWRYELLVALHELVEVNLCRHRKISQESVDAFDIAFEQARKPGNDDEPGDDPRAPYRREHFFATNIEALMSAELGVDWAKYEKKIYSLP